MKAPFPAKLCVGSCKALRGQMQSFALAVAKLCVGTCNALRSEMGKTGTEIVSHILDKRKERNDSPYGTLYPLGNYCRTGRRHGRIETIIGGST